MCHRKVLLVLQRIMSLTQEIMDHLGKMMLMREKYAHVPEY